MRLRAPAALSQRRYRAHSAFCEDDMPDHRSPTVRAREHFQEKACPRLDRGWTPVFRTKLRQCKNAPAGPIALMLLAAVMLAACVQSKTPMLTGTKPELGNLFQLNFFENFSDGMAATVKTSVFRWDATRYVHVSGDSSEVKYFVMEPLSPNTFLIEATDEKVYAYLLAVRQAEGIYRVQPVDETNLDKATQARLCAAQSSDNCTVATRQQLDAFVHASLGKTFNYAMFAVISSPSN
jgi:hypothetical protein